VVCGWSASRLSNHFIRAFKSGWFIYCSILAQAHAHTIPRTFDRLKISHSRITAFRETYPDPISDETKEKRLKNLSRGVYNGYMSHKTKIKVKDYLHNWINSVDRFFIGKRAARRKAGVQFVFVTLTLPAYQNHTDQEIKTRALKPFIQQLIRKHNVRNYLWVSETQKNGNLHFHLVIDRKMDYMVLRRLWNTYMSDLNYIQDYRDGQQHTHKNGFNYRSELEQHWPKESQLLAYKTGTAENWTNPNSTDIKRIQHVRNLPSYLTKYITKSDGSRPIDGRLWGCSDTLRDVKAINIPLSSRLKQVIMALAQENGSMFFGTDFNWTLWRFDSNVLHNLYPVLAEIWYNFSIHCIRMLYPNWLKKGMFDFGSSDCLQPSLALLPTYA
jgi:hypothetical protein